MSHRRARNLGRIVQGTVLGLLLALALMRLLVTVTGGAVFRYQGF